MSGTIFCPNCGAEIAAKARFCGKCGFAIPASLRSDDGLAREAVGGGAAGQNNRRRYVMAGVGVLGVLLVVILGWNVGRFIAGATGPDAAQVSSSNGGSAESSTALARLPGTDSTAVEEDATGTNTATATATATTTGTATGTSTATQTASATAQPTLRPSPHPSATPWPTFTALPPPPTVKLVPTVTPRPASCSWEALRAIRGSWQAHADRLGCAANGGADNVEMAVERFEAGRMLWRGNNDKIYVLYDSGSWQQFDDPWVEGEPTFTCGVEESPPTPVRGFGKLWCTQSRVQEQLGAAVEAERPARGITQDFAGGLIISVEGDTLVLTSDGIWR